MLGRYVALRIKNSILLLSVYTLHISPPIRGLVSGGKKRIWYVLSGSKVLKSSNIAGHVFRQVWVGVLPSNDDVWEPCSRERKRVAARL